MANFIRDDLAKVGIRVTLTPIDFNTLITNIRDDFQYDAILLGFQSSVPPTPVDGQNVWRSSGESHYWFVTPAEAGDAGGGAHRSRCSTRCSRPRTARCRRRAWKEIQNIMNEQAWFIWLPIQTIKLPVSNRFGNVQPSVMAHRILWNIDRVFVKPRES